jgi:hypothetical protein
MENRRPVASSSECFGESSLSLNLVCANIDDVIHDARETVAALIEIRRARVVTSVNGGTAGEQGVRQRWAAIILQWAEQGIANDVGFLECLASAKEIEPRRHRNAAEVSPVVAGDNGVPDVWTAADASGAPICAIAGNRTIADNNGITKDASPRARGWRA